MRFFDKNGAINSHCSLPNLKINGIFVVSNGFLIVSTADGKKLKWALELTDKYGLAIKDETGELWVEFIPHPTCGEM